MENKQFRTKLRAKFPFLSDPGQKVAKQYTGTERGGMDASSVFLIDRQGRVHWRYLGGVTDRPAATEVLKQLDLVEKEERARSDSADEPEPCPALEE